MENTKDYEQRIVKILDAQVNQEFHDDPEGSSSFQQSLILLLQDVVTDYIYETILSENDVRAIVKTRDQLTSKQLIDLAMALRQREEPLSLMAPKNGNISVNDILKEQPEESPKPYKRKRKRRRRNNNQNRTQ